MEDKYQSHEAQKDYHLPIEEITCFDPAMGSDHILIYMFDLLVEIYRKCGYVEQEIPRYIIEKNLFGLDIDQRAYQLACFSLVMKAMSYNPHFLKIIKKEGLTINLAAIEETNHLSDDKIEELVGNDKREHLLETRRFLKQFHDAKTVGSLIKVTKQMPEFLQKKLNLLQSLPAKKFETDNSEQQLTATLQSLLKQTDIMSRSYHVVVVTNPPYMGARKMNDTLKCIFKNQLSGCKSRPFCGVYGTRPLFASR